MKIEGLIGNISRIEALDVLPGQTTNNIVEKKYA